MRTWGSSVGEGASRVTTSGARADPKGCGKSLEMGASGFDTRGSILNTRESGLGSRGSGFDIRARDSFGAYSLSNFWGCSVSLSSSSERTSPPNDTSLDILYTEISTSVSINNSPSSALTSVQLRLSNPQPMVGMASWETLFITQCCFNSSRLFLREDIVGLRLEAGLVTR